MSKVNKMEYVNSLIADICKKSGVSKGLISDGYHTFDSLYQQRCVLFASLCNTFKAISWKSKKHSDGLDCFGGGWFIVGIDTPEGSYTYHYEDKDWDKFEVQELEVAKEWDGHTDKDVERLLSLGKWDNNILNREFVTFGIDLARGEEISDKWIPVTERLPEKPTYDWVLVQVKLEPGDYYGVPHIAELRNGTWYSDAYETTLEETAGVKVTHWMPLPAFPKE